MTASEIIESLVLAVSRHLVEQPDQVLIATKDQEDVISVILTVAPCDIGRVIGKQGRTASSLRILLSAAGLKLNRRVTLDIANS